MLKSYLCIDCGETDPTRFQGSHRRCRRCVDKRRRNKPGYREKQAAFYKDWYEKKGRNRRKDYKNIIYLWNQEHEDIVKIHQMISATIKKGVLVRPKLCSICGNGGRINAHHTDYNFPFKVFWVCSSCHKKIHKGSLTI